MEDLEIVELKALVRQNQSSSKGVYWIPDKRTALRIVAIAMRSDEEQPAPSESAIFEDGTHAELWNADYSDFYMVTRLGE